MAKFLKSSLFHVSLTCLGFIFAFSFAEILASALKDAKVGRDPSDVDAPPQIYSDFFQYDAILGHRGIPNISLSGKGQRHNNFGFRGSNLSLKKAPGVSRIAILGDSQTWGWGVSNSETIQHYVALELNKGGARPTEVINFGVPGYSLDQEFLQYVSVCREFDIDHLVLVIFSGNDFDEFSQKIKWGIARPHVAALDNTFRVANLPVDRGKAWGQVKLGSLFSGWKRLSDASNLIDLVGQRRIDPLFECHFCISSECIERCELFSEERRFRSLRDFYGSLRIPQTMTESVRDFLSLLFVFRDIVLKDGVTLTVVAIQPSQLMSLSGNALGHKAVVQEARSRGVSVINSEEISFPPGKKLADYELDGYHYNSEFNRLISESLMRTTDLGA